MEYGFVWLYKNSTLSAPTLPFPTKVELNPYSRFLQHQKLSSPFSPLLNHSPPSMRIQPIRKRINPPSPPLLSPPPPLHRHSRPYILRPSDSQNQTPQDKDRQPSNLTIVAASGTNGVDYSSDEMNNSTTNQGSPVGDGEQVEAEANSTVATNRRLGHCSYGTETSAGGGSIFLSPSSHQGHWCEEDKLFPLKKRRASFTCKLRARMASDEEQQKKGIRQKPRKTENSPVVKHYYESENEDDQQEDDDAFDQKYETKTRVCGEGCKTPVVSSNSFCRRNNGNGWKCNRPTVLGNSLCEYHLSHARLRNQTCCVQTRNPRNGPKNMNNFTEVYTSLYLEEEEEDFNDKGFEKRGVKKARSISSLLSQTVPKYTNTQGNALTI